MRLCPSAAETSGRAVGLVPGGGDGMGSIDDGIFEGSLGPVEGDAKVKLTDLLELIRAQFAMGKSFSCSSCGNELIALSDGVETHLYTYDGRVHSNDRCNLGF